MPVNDRQIEAARDDVRFFVGSEARARPILRVIDGLVEERDTLRTIIVRQEQALARLTLEATPHVE